MPGDLPLDRVTRPVTERAARLLLGVAAMPLVGLYVAGQRISGGAQRAASRWPEAQAEPAAIWPRPGGIDEAFARVMAISARPSRGGRATVIRHSLHDWPLMLLTAKPEFAQIGFRYPRAFEHRVLTGADGEPIATLTALREGAPAVLVVHGAMTTKGFDYVRRTAVRLWRAGFSVVAPDLRGFGGTSLASRAPNSLGFKEGEDLVAIDAWLRARGAPSVGAIGFSLGGAVALNAARVASERGAGLDGGVIALCPPTDVAEALARLSTRPSMADPLYATWLTLRAAATARLRAAGAGIDAVTPLAAAAAAIPAFYGIDVDEAARRSSANGFAASLAVPVLVIHAEDDFVVPVSHTRRLAQAAAGNDRVRILTPSWGGHTAFDALDPAWMAAVERAWFGTLRCDEGASMNCK